MKGGTFFSVFLVILTLVEAQTCPNGGSPLCGQADQSEITVFSSGGTPNTVYGVAQSCSTALSGYCLATVVTNGITVVCPTWSYPVDASGRLSNFNAVGCSAHPFIIAAFSMSLASLLYVVVSISYHVYVYFKARAVKPAGDRSNVELNGDA